MEKHNQQNWIRKHNWIRSVIEIMKHLESGNERNQNEKPLDASPMLATGVAVAVPFARIRGISPPNEHGHY